MELKRSDFTYECNSQGYMILYKGNNIGGAGPFNHCHEPVGGEVLVQLERYREFAKNAIENIMAGNPGQVFKEAIDKINEEEAVSTTKILDLKVIQAQLNGEEPEYDEENDIWTKTIFLGSVMNLTPSGKYYVPFAHSNVEICKTCRATGSVPCTEDNPCKHQDDSEDTEEYHCEACKDARWFEQVEEELAQIDAYLFSGEGCATDLMVGIVVESGDE